MAVFPPKFCQKMNHVSLIEKQSRHRVCGAVVRKAVKCKFVVRKAAMFYILTITSDKS